MGLYNRTFFSDEMHFEHSANKKHAEYGTANSVSSEKGTDNKKNNTSEYNHEYYEKNKEKWEKNSKKRNFEKLGHYDPNEDDEDFKKVYGDDLKNPKLNMDTHIKGTDFYQVTNKEGQVVLINGNKKWTLPKGVKLTDGMKQALAGIDSNGGKQTGDFQTKMEKFLDDAKKEHNSTKKTKKSSEETTTKETSSKESSGKVRSISEAYEDLKKDEEEEKKKNIKHSDDLGSVFVRDLY